MYFMLEAARIMIAAIAHLLLHQEMRLLRQAIKLVGSADHKISYMFSFMKK